MELNSPLIKKAAYNVPIEDTVLGVNLSSIYFTDPIFINH